MGDESQSENSKQNSKKKGEHLAPYHFKPGESGNPGGRPKKKPISELYERLLEDPAFMGQVEESIRKMVASGRMVGQLQLKEMAERVEGKVSQAIELNGELTLKISERMKKAEERLGKPGTE